MIDGLTGWADAVPIVDQSAPTVGRAVYIKWILKYGVQEQLHSDRGVSSSLQCSRSYALYSDSIRRGRLCTGLKRTETATNLIGH